MTKGAPERGLFPIRGALAVSTAHYRILNYGFAVDTDLFEIRDPLAHVLMHDAQVTPDTRPRRNYRIRGTVGDYRVIVGGRCVQRGRTAEGIVDFVLWDAHVRAIAGVHDRIALHAAAACRGGRAVLLPAPPDAGKTTTVAALVVSGFGYLTDEVALIDPETLDLRAYPRALRMNERSARLVTGNTETVTEQSIGPARHLLCDELRPDSRADSARVAVIVEPRYRPGEATDLRPVSRAKMLTLLARNSFNIHRWGSAGVERLAALVAGTDAYRLTMGDLWEGVAAIESLFPSEEARWTA
jgi:hypothetical protein